MRAFEWDSLEQSRFPEMPNRSSRGPAAVLGIEHIPEVFGVHDPERSDSGESLTLRSVQFVRLATMANEFAFTSARQV